MGIVTISENFVEANAMEILARGWDLVVDGSDNAATRYLISDACVQAKLPVVSGSALQWEGQVTILNHNKGPCYRCLYPRPPPPETVTNCSDGGVLGMVPGLIGQIQAIEVVKILLGFEDSMLLNRRMLIFDGMMMKFRNVKKRDRNPACVACGDNPSIGDISKMNYNDFCQTNCQRVNTIELAEENKTTVERFAENVSVEEDVVIDVRPPV